MKLISKINFAPQLQEACLKMPLPNAVKKFMTHPAGPFTIFFWAPTFKWSITFANIGDMKKPAELISPNQQIAVMATGLIWTRWGFVITPINYNLSICNFFMSMTGVYQIYRKM